MVTVWATFQFADVKVSEPTVGTPSPGLLEVSEITTLATGCDVSTTVNCADPPASVEASWPGGGQHGETPIQIRVPKDSTVKLVFTRAGYKPETRELSVAQAQAVTAALAPEK